MNPIERLKRPLTSAVGSRAERATESHLNDAGLRTVCRNYRCRAGEIDLIMEDGEQLVFVEVRFRRNNDYGNPLESITVAKQKRIARAAAHFLLEQPRYRQRPCRFDAVGVSPMDQGVDYDWIKAAFST